MLLRSKIHSLRGVGQFVGSGHGLHDDVLFFYAEGFERFDAPVEEGGDDGCVPAGVDYADAEVGTCCSHLEGYHLYLFVWCGLRCEWSLTDFTHHHRFSLHRDL